METVVTSTGAIALLTGWRAWLALGILAVISVVVWEGVKSVFLLRPARVRPSVAV